MEKSSYHANHSICSSKHTVAFIRMVTTNGKRMVVFHSRFIKAEYRSIGFLTVFLLFCQLSLRLGVQVIKALLFGLLALLKGAAELFFHSF